MWHTFFYFWLILSKISSAILVLWAAIEFAREFWQRMTGRGETIFYRALQGILLALVLPAWFLLEVFVAWLPPNLLTDPPSPKTEVAHVVPHKPVGPDLRYFQ